MPLRRRPAEQAGKWPAEDRAPAPWPGPRRSASRRAIRPRSVSIMRRSCSAFSSTTVVATEQRQAEDEAGARRPAEHPASAAPRPCVEADLHDSAGHGYGAHRVGRFSEKCRPTPNIGGIDADLGEFQRHSWSATKPGCVGPDQRRRRSDSRPAAGCGSGWRWRRE